MVKFHAGRGERINVWRFVESAAEASDVCPAKIVDEEENEIGSIAVGGGLRGNVREE